jgi:hypothetical protein
MDMFAANQLNAPRWRFAKLVAFVCFGLACCLLGASLVVSQPSPSAGQPPPAPAAASAH